MYEIFQKVFQGNVQSHNRNTVRASPKSQNSRSDSAGNRGVVNYITDQTSQDPAMAVPGPVHDPDYSNTDPGNSAEQTTDSVDAESDDLLQQMSSEYEPTGEKGPAVQEKLANIFQDLVQGIHKEEKLNSVVDSINPPCNVEGLEVTKVNTEVWRRSSLTARSNDLKLQKLKALMIKQMALATITANKLHIAKSDSTKTTSEIIKLALKCYSDSTMLLGQLNSGLLSRRREFILPVSYRQLSYDQKAYSKWLFGDNLLQAIKDKTKSVKSYSGKLKLVIIANHKDNVFYSEVGVNQKEGLGEALIIANCKEDQSFKP